LVLERTSIASVVLPSSAVSKTRSRPRVVELVPVYCWTWRARDLPPSMLLVMVSFSVVGLNWTGTAVPVVDGAAPAVSCWRDAFASVT